MFFFNCFNNIYIYIYYLFIILVSFYAFHYHKTHRTKFEQKWLTCSQPFKEARQKFPIEHMVFKMQKLTYDFNCEINLPFLS